MLEKEIQKQILNYLEIKRVFHYRQNSGAFETKNGGFIRCGCKGSPDIIAVIKGKYVGIEVKAKCGKQSPAQKEFEGRLRKAGGDYWLVRSLDDLIKFLGY